MISPMIDPQMNEYIKDLLNPDKGFFLIKGFLNPQQTDQYRCEAEQFMRTAPRLYKRVNKPNMPDYVHPRTVLPNGKQVKREDQTEKASTYRLYQFLHNKHSKETKNIFRRALSLRDQIEEGWLSNNAYRRKKGSLDDYIQVTKYIIDSYGLPKHTDFRVELPYPLLQCLILLSNPGIDFLGGEFILYTKNGQKIRMHSEVDMDKGDALFFDKSLYHEVEPTQQSSLSEIGRWTVIIGARQPKPPELFKRIRHTAIQFLRRITGWLRRRSFQP